MATSTAKTIGLILLVVIIIFFAFQMTPLILTPFGFFSGFLHLMRNADIGRISFWPYRFFTFTSLSILSLAMLAIWILVIVWVYRDAERRGMNGVLWALLVFIGNLIGLLIYLLVRSDSLALKLHQQSLIVPIARNQSLPILSSALTVEHACSLSVLNAISL